MLFGALLGIDAEMDATVGVTALETTRNCMNYQIGRRGCKSPMLHKPLWAFINISSEEKGMTSSVSSNVYFVVGHSLRATMEEYCEKRGLNRSEFIRQAILEKLEREGVPVTDDTRTRGQRNWDKKQ